MIQSSLKISSRALNIKRYKVSEHIVQMMPARAEASLPVFSFIFGVMISGAAANITAVPAM